MAASSPSGNAAADPTKVVFYLDGGGSCFDATTCAFTGTGGENDFYDFNLSTESRGLGGGIFDFDRADNPFADYSFIYVPLCTGDVYLGDATREYSPDLTVEHNGFVNGTAALSYLAEYYPDATQVVVVGKTGGSVAAPVYGGLVADLLPDAQVTVFGAQSGAFPDDPEFNAEILGALWGAYATMPDWEVNDGLTASDWGITRFWIQAGLHDPDIVMARFDYAFDRNAARTLECQRCGLVDHGRVDRRQRGGDRGRRCDPAQLHRTRRRPRDLRVRQSSTRSRSTASRWSTGSTRCSPVNRSTTSTATTAKRPE